MATEAEVMRATLVERLEGCVAKNIYDVGLSSGEKKMILSSLALEDRVSRLERLVEHLCPDKAGDV